MRELEILRKKNEIWRKMTKNDYFSEGYCSRMRPFDGQLYKVGFAEDDDAFDNLKCLSVSFCNIFCQVLFARLFVLFIENILWQFISFPTSNQPIFFTALSSTVSTLLSCIFLKYIFHLRLFVT